MLYCIYYTLYTIVCLYTTSYILYTIYYSLYIYYILYIIYYILYIYYIKNVLDSSWNVMPHGDAREGKWRWNWQMERVASTLHTTSEHGVSSITTADTHTSAASSRLNWQPSADLNGLVRFAERRNLGFCVCVCHHISNAVYHRHLRKRKQIRKQTDRKLVCIRSAWRPTACCFHNDH